MARSLAKSRGKRAETGRPGRQWAGRGDGARAELQGKGSIPQVHPGDSHCRLEAREGSRRLRGEVGGEWTGRGEREKGEEPEQNVVCKKGGCGPN